MRTILSVVVAVTCLLSGCADIDGWVEQADVCTASYDIAEQDDMLRPSGGTLSVPGDLQPEQVEAVIEATDIRRERSGAEWAVVVGPNRLKRGDDGVLLASCERGDLDVADKLGQDAWSYTKRTGGVGVIWSEFATEGWAYGIAAQLRALEGAER